MGTRSISKLMVEVTILCSEEPWIEIVKPKIQPMEVQYKVADGNQLQVLGQFKATAELDAKARGVNLMRKELGKKSESPLTSMPMEPLWFQYERHTVQDRERPRSKSVGIIQ